MYQKMSNCFYNHGVQFPILINVYQFDPKLVSLLTFLSSLFKYHFNYLGLLFAGINKIYKKKDRYYCAEFVKNVLNNANINNDLPIPPKPMDFKTLPGKTIYIGKLKTYTYPTNNVLE